MNIVLWIIAGVLAALFLSAGLMKIAQPKEKLAASGMAWVEDFPPGIVRAIGSAEVLAAVGLILPAAVDIAPVLVPLAALGLALLMLGAAVVHARRGESQMVPITLVLLVLPAVVVWGRFGPHAF